MTPPATTAWAIKAPDGKIYLHKIRRNKPELHEWEKEFGRTVVKVQITEMEEGK